MVGRVGLTGVNATRNVGCTAGGSAKATVAQQTAKSSGVIAISFASVCAFYDYNLS